MADEGCSVQDRNSRSPYDSQPDESITAKSSATLAPVRPIHQRTITPKGTLFTNLGEAHQAITAKAASRSTGNTPPETPKDPFETASTISTPTESTISTGTTHRFPVPKGPRPMQRRVPTPFHGPSLTQAAIEEPPPVPTTATVHDFRSTGNNDSVKDKPGHETETSAVVSSSDSDSTVGKIYSQYLPSSSVEPSSSIGGAEKSFVESKTAPEVIQSSAVAQEKSEPATKEKPTPVAQTPHTKRRNVPSTVRSSKTLQKIWSPPGEPPKIPLPEIPTKRKSAKNPSTGVSTRISQASAHQPATPSSKSEAMLKAPARESTSSKLVVSPTYSGSFTSNPKPQIQQSAIARLVPNMTKHGKSQSAAVNKITSPTKVPEGSMHPESNILGNDKHKLSTLTDNKGSKQETQNHLCPDPSSLSTQSHLIPPDVSTAAISTDSEEDPFKYDNIKLTRDREREVSMALRCLSGMSTTSMNCNFGSSSPFANLQSSSPFANVQTSSPLTPLTPPCAANEQPQTANQKGHSINPFTAKLQYYKAPEVRYNWDEFGEPNEVEVKVTICPPPIPCVEEEIEDKNKLPPVPPNTPVLVPDPQSSTLQSKLTRESRAARHQTILSDGADWETVPDSIGHFDSNRAIASSSYLTESHIGKPTGSSIADYSDDDSDVRTARGGIYSSTDRILPQPPPSVRTHPRYPRLSETERPIFVPKPRIHKVNGYLNPARLFTDPTTTASSANTTRSNFVEKISNSIRSCGFGKRDDSRHPYQYLEGSGNLGSLNSFLSCEMEPLKAKPQTGNGDAAHATGQPLVSQAETNLSYKEKVEKWKLETPSLGLSTTTGNKVGFASTEHRKSIDARSPTQFAFPLISLEEAARREAMKRSTENSTLKSTTETKMNSATANLNGIQKSVVTISKPQPVHKRAPTGNSAMAAGNIYINDSQGKSALSYLLVLPSHWFVFDLFTLLQKLFSVPRTAARMRQLPTARSRPSQLV